MAVGPELTSKDLGLKPSKKAAHRRSVEQHDWFGRRDRSVIHDHEPDFVLKWGASIGVAGTREGPGMPNSFFRRRNRGRIIG